MSPQAVQHPAPLPAGPPGQAPPLWRELADGSAGVAVRAVVSFALAPLLAGAACFASYVLAGVVPAWASGGRGYFGPSEGLLGCTLGLAAVAYLAALAVIWTRGRVRVQALWRAALLTLATFVLVVVTCVVIDETRLLRGSQEVLIAAVICVAGGAIILLWLQAIRAFLRGKPSHDPADGTLDVRCPSCGYRMVGLRESRCPECGTAYTIDELLGQQEFMTPQRRPQGVTPPADPAETAGVEGDGVAG